VSTSLLYHGFGIRGYRHVRTEYKDGAIIFAVEQDLSELRCPDCGCRDVIRRGQIVRRFRTVPIGRRRVWVELPVQRVQCRSCGVVQQAKVAFASERRSYTDSFERYALELCRHMTILAVARHLGVSWDLIKDIHKRNLHRRFGSPKLRGLTHIAIDEICIGRGYRFLTIVLDLLTGAVVFVGRGKGKEALIRFWRRLERTRTRQDLLIQAVAIDMSPAYLAAVWENIPDAAVVFDRFHVIKLYNEKLTRLRSQMHHAAVGLGKKVLEGTRWLLLKNPENLDTSKNEHRRLQEALEINQPLATAYYLKEDLRQFWEQADKAAAERFLDDWLVRAEASGITVLKKLARTLRLYRFGLIAWYDHPISTGPLEGTNNKIKTLQRQAYGFRDQQYFTLRIYSLHETKYALVG
jgi:transposase